MDIASNSAWMTNFIYQQDLTSYYMNNTLTGVLHPGVYNYNLGIYFDDSGNLHVTIKKGTTLIFSNDYDGGGTKAYSRNFTNNDLTHWKGCPNIIHTKSLIKSVAQYDIDETLENSVGLASLTKDYYIFARIIYKRDTSSEGDLKPILLLAENGGSSDGYTYKVCGKEDIDTQYQIPDGCLDYTNNSTLNRDIYDYFFLCLGKIQPLKTTIETLADVAFTTRGLPEYNHSIVTDYNRSFPDIWFSDDYKKIGVNIKKTLFNNCIVDSRSSCDLQKLLSNQIAIIFGYINNNDLKLGSKTFTIAGLESISTLDKTGVLSTNAVNEVLPLDTCAYNINRLLIKNNDIWDKLVDSLQKEGNANDIKNIVPIALIHGDSSDLYYAHPNRVLSYFDLYFKSSSITIYNGTTNNIFNVIPII